MIYTFSPSFGDEFQFLIDCRKLAFHVMSSHFKIFSIYLNCCAADAWGSLCCRYIGDACSLTGWGIAFSLIIIILCGLVTQREFNNFLPLYVSCVKYGDRLSKQRPCTEIETFGSSINKHQSGYSHMSTKHTINLLCAIHAGTDRACKGRIPPFTDLSFLIWLFMWNPINASNIENVFF